MYLKQCVMGWRAGHADQTVTVTPGAQVMALVSAKKRVASGICRYSSRIRVPLGSAY